ncbi:hypothetical protein TNIN_433711 [Trichonephila inaurata madagascariensis]|uniref:Uncharacterized protein n=1 Tax=Trichonephila inaurata madagascariensis TaxID=2747483 RepID=A0A8X6XQX7_9ARAC|nr:hypothetical protein TNIN_433711 [Trichonephila inaurata madagascariensis]
MNPDFYPVFISELIAPDMALISFADIWILPDSRSVIHDLCTGLKHTPGGALTIKVDRVVQFAIFRLASGHIKCLSFVNGQNACLMGSNCNSVQASLEHLLNFVNLVQR